MKLVGDLYVHGNDFRRRQRRAHVRVQMRRMNSDGERLLNLRAVFTLNLLGLGFLSNVLGERPERARWIQER